MTFTFDFEELSLRHPASAKWTMFPDDVLPLWVADMDFPVAPVILQALQDRLRHGLGYSPFEGEPALMSALIERHGAVREGLHLLPGVVPGLHAAVRACTSPGDEVITHVPIYPPFMSSITESGRVAKFASLVRGPGGYEMDFDAMEAAVTPATRLFMLCNPQNPTGRTWTRPELERLADFALRHRLWVLTDELHADLTLDGTFVPFASLSGEIAARTITLTGPAKAFNTAGLGIGAAFSSNLALMERVRKVTYGITGHPSGLAQTAWRAALEEGGSWLGECRDVLRARRDFLTHLLKRHLPLIRFDPPQATYLAWLDTSAYELRPSPGPFLLERARVALNDGPTFGPGFDGFARLNFATSERVLEEAVRRIAEAVQARDA